MFELQHLLQVKQSAFSYVFLGWHRRDVVAKMVVTPNMKLGCISFAKSGVRQQVDVTTFVSDTKK